jgi:hypothetical protein
MLITVGRYIDTKHWGILYVQHCGKIYSVLTIQYSSVFCVNKSSHSVQHTVYSSVFCVNKSSEYCMLKTVRRFIYTKYWGIVNADHCGKIYWHKTLRNTLCSALWEDLCTHNTEEYCMFNTGPQYFV